MKVTKHIFFLTLYAILLWFALGAENIYAGRCLIAITGYFFFVGCLHLWLTVFLDTYDSKKTQVLPVWFIKCYDLSVVLVLIACGWWFTAILSVGSSLACGIARIVVSEKEKAEIAKELAKLEEEEESCSTIAK